MFNCFVKYTFISIYQLLSKKMKGVILDDDINHDVENATLKVASDNDEDKPRCNRG